MKKSIRHFALAALLVFGLTAAGGVLVGCDPVSKSATQILLCNDEDAPLFCIESQICCAETHPFECNEKCYRTEAQAKSDCSGDVSDCS